MDAALLDTDILNEVLKQKNGSVVRPRRAHYASMANGGVLRHCGIGYDFLYFESTDPSYKEDTE